MQDTLTIPICQTSTYTFKDTAELIAFQVLSFSSLKWRLLFILMCVEVLASEILVLRYESRALSGIRLSLVHLYVGRDIQKL